VYRGDGDFAVPPNRWGAMSVAQEVSPVPEGMSEYDRKAWAEVQAWKDKRLRAQVRRRMPVTLRKRAEVIGGAVSRGLRAVPGSGQFERYFSEAMESLLHHGFDVAVASVRIEAILAAYREAGFEVRRLEDIRTLGLADIDRVKPNLALPYATAAMVEGAGAGLAVTGGELLTVTGAGPAVVVSAVAGDAAATLIGGLRLVAHTAAYYGFDASNDENEMATALGMLSVGVAVGPANKAAAYRELSRVTQQLVRRGAWSRTREFFGGKGTVPRSSVTRLISRVLTQLGFKATARNVEKMLPVVGIGLGAGQNVAMFRRVAASADQLCRERWLAEWYGITADVPDVPEGGEAVAIADIIDELVAEPDVGADTPDCGETAVDADIVHDGEGERDE
jgi:hypothetical protein